MTRRLATIATVMAMAPVTGLFAGVPVVSATEPPCTYQMSPPELIRLPGGGEAMTATLEATACPGVVNPTTSTVCIDTPEGPGNCETAFGWEPVHVYVTASRYDGTFTARGQGCWKAVHTSESACAASGPVSTTI